VVGEEDGGGVVPVVRWAALRSPGLYYNAGDGDDDDRNVPRTRQTRIVLASSSSDVWFGSLLC